MRTSSPGAEGRSQRGEAGRGGARSPETGYPGPPWGEGRVVPARRWRSGDAAPAARPGALPARLPGSPPPAISARQQSGNGSGASPGSAGTRPGSAAGGSAGSVPPAFVLAASRGARPGAMKGPSVCAERPRSPFILNIIFTSFLTEQRFSWNFSPSSKNTCARVCVCKSSFTVKVGIVQGRGSAKPEAGSERDRNAFLPAQRPPRGSPPPLGCPPSRAWGLGEEDGDSSLTTAHTPTPG